jgi:AraC family transcriptional regulator
VPPELIEQALVYIQANLDQAPSLDAVATHVGLSASHFHRQFHTAVGQTPKEFTTRLQLERAAFRLLLHDDTVLQVALDCGYNSHETFTRAFRRHFGTSPSDYRDGDRMHAGSTEGSRRRSPLGRRGYRLSATSVRALKPLELACIRHVGPYEDVPESLYDRLHAWAERQGLPAPRTFLGIGHDPPGPSARYDAAVQVRAPFEPEDDIEHRTLAGGSFAVTTHVGPFDTLPSAYAQLFGRVVALDDVEIVGLPVIEIYRTTRVSVSATLNHTDIYIPVKRPRFDSP